MIKYLQVLSTIPTSREQSIRREISIHKYCADIDNTIQLANPWSSALPSGIIMYYIWQEKYSILKARVLLDAILV